MLPQLVRGDSDRSGGTSVYPKRRHGTWLSARSASARAILSKPGTAPRGSTTWPVARIAISQTRAEAAPRSAPTDAQLAGDEVRNDA